MLRPMTDPALPHVIIIGGGFAGLAAVRKLRRAPVRVTLIDRRNHHLFQPLLYQVATAALSAPDIAAPIRRLLRGYTNTTVLLGAVTAVDPARRTIRMDDGEELAYDYLIVAAGASNTWFGHDDAWAHVAPGLKTIDDAFAIRWRILGAYEEAERELDPARRAWLLTFVVVGAGPTGVELAGALNEISRHTMRQNFRNFDPSSARVVLIEGGPRILPTFADRLAAKAKARLTKTGVEVKVGVKVTHIDERGVDLDAGASGDEPRPERLDAATVLWAAGVRGASLGQHLGVETDRGGRVPVTPTLALSGHAHTYVVGDLAHVARGDGTIPGIAPAAIQMGAHAAENVRRQLAGETPTAFRYRDKGAMATIGRAVALVDTPKMKLFGFFAWLIWAFVHILYLVSFRSRVAVLFEWGWAYFSWNRPGRIILERAPRHGQRSDRMRP